MTRISLNLGSGISVEKPLFASSCLAVLTLFCVRTRTFCWKDMQTDLVSSQPGDLIISMRPTKASRFIRATASVLCLCRLAWHFISPSLLQWKYDAALIEFISTVRAAWGSAMLWWEERDSGFIFERCESQINFFTRAFNVGKHHAALTCVAENICLCVSFLFASEKLPLTRSMSRCTRPEFPVLTSFLSLFFFFSCSNLDFFMRQFYISLGRPLCLHTQARTCLMAEIRRCVCLPVEGHAHTRVPSLFPLCRLFLHVSLCTCMCVSGSQPTRVSAPPVCTQACAFEKRPPLWACWRRDG